MGLLDQVFVRVCGRALPPVDTVVGVSHGPVRYDDRRRVINAESDMPTSERLALAR